MELPQKLTESVIRRGTILHSTLFDNIDHGKFFVVIGVSQNRVVGFFFINSNIHPALRNRPEQLAMQYPMRRKDYPFLRYDSFLCATGFIKRPLKDLAQSLADSTSKVVGTMRESHMEELLQSVRRSRLFTPKDLRDFCS